MQIGSVRNLLEILDNDTYPGPTMFRGQTRDWSLLPSIGRYPAVVRGYDDWRGLHDDIIDRFLRLGHPFLSEYPKSGPESWVVGQHHGLPTRLLDTTTNPLKGLFFAVNHPAEDPEDGVLWIFSYTGWREDLKEEHRKYWDDELVPFLPPRLTPRLTAQEGAFISYPLPKDRKPLKPVDKFKQDNLSLDKIVVPAATKAILRRELAALGVQFRLLFPDLDGVARGIRLTELES
jgi:hypothetical protein